MRRCGFSAVWRTGLALATCVGASLQAATAQALPAMPDTAHAQIPTRVQVPTRVQALIPTSARVPASGQAQVQAPDLMQAQVHVQVETLCGVEGYRVMARRWDALLQRNLEVRQDCTHPEWPARLVALASTNMSSSNAFPMERVGIVPVRTVEAAAIATPLLVHAGDRVRLWSQDERVRIEMSGVVEKSARCGDRVMVQVTRRSEETGMTVDRLAGVVRAAGDVEMEP